MDPTAFLQDLLELPESMTRLAGSLRAEDPWAAVPRGTSHLVLLGMGSSHYASSVAAARLRAAGVDAVAELASHDLLPAPREGTVVVAVSASGGSQETLAAVGAYLGRCPVIALTNTADSALGALADVVVQLEAGVERGGVACRSFRHTIAMELALLRRITGAGAPVEAVLDRAADATADLLERRSSWLPDVRELLLGPNGTHVVAPARRLSSAQQSALMLREGPRLPAVGCETGDWSHVDVYLTRTTDYRMLLLAGSRWEPNLLGWTRSRGTTVVALGGGVDDARLSLRYRGDEEDDVRLLAEVVVAELVAAQAWAEPAATG